MSNRILRNYQKTLDYNLLHIILNTYTYYNYRPIKVVIIPYIFLNNLTYVKIIYLFLKIEQW